MEFKTGLELLGLDAQARDKDVESTYRRLVSGLEARRDAASTHAERARCETELDMLAKAREVVLATLRLHREKLRTSQLRDLPGAEPRYTKVASAENTSSFVLGPGSTIGTRYVVEECLGVGGMGEVYAVRDKKEDRLVALKVMRPGLMQDPSALQRFLSEAEVTRSLDHPNIVHVYDVQRWRDVHFFTMELLSGRTLRAWMDERKTAGRKFTVTEVRRVARAVCAALAYAHRLTVHRDVKPENIWVEEDGTIKLMDFGLATSMTPSQLTMTGMSMGTAYYMAPEQLKGERDIDARADQFSVAVMLYEMLSGEVPVGRAAPIAKVRSDVPKPMSNAIDKALRPRREDRFDWIDRFQSALSERGVHGLEKIGVAVLVLLLLGVGWILGLGDVVRSALEDAPAEAPGAAKKREGGSRPGRGPRQAEDPEAVASALAAIREALSAEGRLPEALVRFQALEGVARALVPRPVEAADTLLELAQRLHEAGNPLEAYAVAFQAETWEGREVSRHLLRTLDREIEARLAGAVALESPEEDALVLDGRILVRGRVLDPSVVASVGVGDQTEEPTSGRFEVAARVPRNAKGRHEIVIEVRDRHGHVAALRRTVLIDAEAPTVEIVRPRDEERVSEAELRVVGTVKDDTDCEVVVNDVPAEVRSGRWEARVPVVQGENILHVAATDAAGHTSETSITVVADFEGPSLLVDAPRSGTALTSSTVTVAGRVEDAVELLVDGAAVRPDAEGRFETEVTLGQGPQVLRVTAKDEAGNVVERQIQIRVDSVPPRLDVLEPRPSDTDARIGLVPVRGHVRDAGRPTVTVNGREATLEPDEDGWRWHARVELSLEDMKIEVKAVDDAGNATRPVLRHLRYTAPTTLEQSRRFEPAGKNEQGFFEYRLRADPEIVFVLLPHLHFPMGAVTGDEKALHTEKPRRFVHVAPFLLSKYEISYAQFTRFADATSRFRPKTPLTSTNRKVIANLPVAYVHWEDARAWCEWAKVRLPTEAEWEGAARVGWWTHLHPWDPAEEVPEKAGNFADRSARKIFRVEPAFPGYRDGATESARVTGFPPSACGLHHMLGNVEEWCLDYFAPYDLEDTENPRGPSMGTARVYRGGSYMSGAVELRLSRRGAYPPDQVTDTLGFRPAISLREVKAGRTMRW